ncbi:MAG: sigma-70 family RNA polymerase sigma factor [Lachnospiraceae bacterium]|nr:sigma-70 family RNA polymerase sigma factor [Lachnospiraceae bacterium]
MNQKKNMDEQILRLMDEHPSEGVSLLMEQYMGLLWSACKLYLDDPEDIRECVQDTIVDFYAGRERFCLEKGTLKAYLYVIARRKAVRAAGQNSLYRTEFLEKEPADGRDEIEQLLNRTVLDQALSKLQEQDSRMIRMRYYDGMTCAEIARSMNLPLETVKKRQQRSLRKLRRILAVLAVLGILTACAAAVVCRIRFSPSTGLQGMDGAIWYECMEVPAVLETDHGKVTLQSLVWKEQELYLQMEIEDSTLSGTQAEASVCLLEPVEGHKRTAEKMSTAQGEGVPSLLKQTYSVPEALDQYTFLIFNEAYTFQMNPIQTYEDFSGIGSSRTHSGRTIVLRPEWTDGRLLADAYTYSENAWKIIRLGTKLHTDWQSERLIDEPVFHYEAEDTGDRPYMLSIDSTVLQFTGEIPVLKIPVPDTSVSANILFRAGEDQYRITKITRSIGTYEYFQMEEDGTETALYGDELLIEIEPVELEADTRLIGFLGDLGIMSENKRYRLNQKTGKLEEIQGTEHFQIRWSGWGSLPGRTLRIPVTDPEELPEEAYLQITDICKYWDQEFCFEIDE